LTDKPTIPTDTDDLTNGAGYITSSALPTKVSDLTNDAGYITGYTETDPTVPSWAKQNTKPSYTASEVGALPDTTSIPSKISDLTDDVGLVTQSTHLWHYTVPTANGYSFSANQYRSLSITLGTTYSGFTAIPVRAVCTSHSAIRVFNYSISNNNTLNFEALSQSSSSISGANFAFTVLWLNDTYF
jgi:hypothetical protein